MFTYYIVKAGETAPEKRIAEAIKNFGYQNMDVLCLAKGGYTSEIETFYIVREELNDYETQDLDALAKAYLEKRIQDRNKTDEA